MLSTEANNLFSEIVQNKGKRDYWANRFDILSKKDEIILRKSFKELEVNKYIKVVWADNIPYIINIINNECSDVDIKEDLFINDVDQSITISVKSKNDDSLKYDVFISHANADKGEFVEELYNSLKKLDVKIFYDKSSLNWGDNWKEQIINGTSKAEFAIIVISKKFFGREWTERELSDFLNKQSKTGQKLILPILHNISIEELKEKYPTVADIQAINSSEHTCDEIAILFAGQLIRRLKDYNRGVI